MRRQSQALAGPSDWQTKPLGAVVDRVTERNREGNQNVLTISAQAGLISQKEFFSRRVASDEVSGYFVLRRGDFAYNKSYSAGFPVGVIRRLERYADGIVSPLYICFRPSADVHSDFLTHYCAAGLLDDDIAWVAKEGVRNHGLLNVRVADLFSVAVHLPPLLEQRRIAEVLGALDDAIRDSELVIAKLMQVKDGLLRDLLTRGIDDNGELRDRARHPEQFKASMLGFVPRSWDVYSVSALLEDGVLLDIQDGNHGELHPKRSEFVTEGVPFLMARDIAGGVIDFEHCYRIRNAQASRLRVGHSRGSDVLLSHKGTIGETALVPSHVSAVVLTPQVTYYRAASPCRRMTPKYLLTWLRGPIFQSALKLLAAQSTRDYVGITAQRSLPVALPPVAEQERIAGVIDQLEAGIDTEVAAVAKMRLLGRGLRKDLLTGRVRVKGLLGETAA
jgi:type I restriction enzyme, S subunit